MNQIVEGESIAVNGVCLTATLDDTQEIRFDVSPETFRKTSLGNLRQEAVVNLERAMRADGRFGGHMVQGHVDGTGTIANIEPNENSVRMTVTFPAPFARYLIEKGSVCVDGISLTVADLSESTFDVWIIPHTWSHTNLCDRKVGDIVNLEFDVLAKVIEKLIASRL